MPDRYPLFLDLEGKPCLVVGGGSVGSRKAAGLLESGAEVTIVSPRAGEAVEALVSAGKIRLERRFFRAEDVEGKWLVLCAVDDPAVGKAVFEACEAARVLVNVADQPAFCRFIVPSRFREGTVQAAVSTGGASPALARKLRMEIEGQLEGWASRLAAWLGELRAELMTRMPDNPKARGRFLSRLVNERFDPLKECARRQDRSGFDAVVHALLEKEVT